MGIFGKGGGGLFGSLLGIALAFTTGGLSVAFSTLATYASIGFTIGNLIAPPEFDEADEEFVNPEVKEGQSVPLIFGKHRTRGIISYFDATQVRKEDLGDFDKLYWGPMQVIVCICEDYPVNDPAGSMYLPGYTVGPTEGTQEETDGLFGSKGLPEGTFIGYQSDSGRQMSVRALEEDGEHVGAFGFFVHKAGVAHLAKSFSGDQKALASALGGYESQYNSKSQTYTTQFTVDLVYKGWPQVFWGGKPVDTWETFSDPNWSPNTYIPYNTDWEDKVDSIPMADSWSDQIPPNKNLLSLASPVWPLGKNTSSAPSWIYEVEGVYPSEPGALFVEILTNKLWGMGLDPITGVNQTTFTDPLYSSFQDANAGVTGDNYAINASIQSQSAKTLVEKMNFHVGTIVREDHLGRLELLAIRSLADGPTFTAQNYIDWIDAGAPDTGGTYQPGFPVLYEVHDEDGSSVQVSNQLWSGAYTSFIAKYKNGADNFSSASVVSRNNATENLLGFTREKSWTFNMFTDRQSVEKRLTQLANQNARPDMRLRMDLPSSYIGIRVGDGIKVWDSRSGLDGVYMRVGSVDLSKVATNQVSVECVLDHESLYDKNLLSIDVEVPAQGQEPEIPDDPHDPNGMSAHPDFWAHNLSYEDASATGTNDKKTHIYVGQGNAQQVAHRDFSIEGTLNPFVGVPVPGIAKGTQTSESWGVQFTTLTDIAEDDFSHALYENCLFLQLVGYTDQDLSALLITKTGSNWETDPTVLVVSGRPYNVPKSTESENVTEVMRYRGLEHVAGDIYCLRNLVRQANKERAPRWVVGTEVWITDLTEVQKDPTLPYDLFPNRSLAGPKSDAGVDEGSHRVRMFTQSVTLDVVAGEEEGTGFIQPETEGLSKTFDALNSQFFSGPSYLESKIPPMAPCTAVRVGDIPKGKGLWFRANLDGVTNLLPDAFDLSSWTSILGTLTPNDAGLNYAEGNSAMTTFNFTSAAGLTSTLRETVTSGLTDTVTYSVCFLIYKISGVSTTFNAKLSATGATDASLNLDWDTGVVSSVLGSASAYDMGNGTFRVFMSSTRTGGNDLDLNLFFSNVAASFVINKVAVGEVLLYEGSTEALYSEKDWLIQFQPTGLLGGIGDQSLVVGGNAASAWGTFVDDADEDDTSDTFPESRGTYKVFATIESPQGPHANITLSGASDETVTIGAGDPWPTMVVSDSDMAAAGSSDAPSLVSHFHPKQVIFSVAKQGTGGNYGVAAKVHKKTPWPQAFIYKA